MLDQILNALIAALQADTYMPETIASYHKVEGMVESVDPTCSVWIPKASYKAYTNDEDEVVVPVHIGIAVNDVEAELGETRVRAFAEEIRMLLTDEQRTLSGLIDDSFLSNWEFASFDASQSTVLHLGEAVWEVIYYASRTRPLTPAEPMDELDFDETIITETETIGG